MSDCRQHVAKLFGFLPIIAGRFEHAPEGRFCLHRLLGVGALSPEDHAGIADLQALAVMLVAAQQMVENSRIGKSDLFGNGCALAFTVGGKSVQVEGHDGRARALRAIHAFDRRM